MMQVIICENYKEMSKKSADIIADEIKKNPRSILGLATGSTPIGLYEELVSMYEKGELNFKDITTFNLDEYYRIRQTDSQSYFYFMNEHLYSKINLKKENINIPFGDADDAAAECERYNKKIESMGGIDIQLLGIGNNGHIGFNEPADFLSARTHQVSLTEDTINANSRFFDSKDEVPVKALTMGMGEIMNARKILVLASGKSKSPIVKEFLNGGITTKVPVSFLNLHNDVVLVLDKEAAALL